MSASIRFAFVAPGRQPPLGLAPRLLDAAKIDYLLYEVPSARQSIETCSILDSREALAISRLVSIVEEIRPALFLDPQLRVALNSPAPSTRMQAESIGQHLAENGGQDLRLGVVLGGDLSGRVEELLASGQGLSHADSGQPLVECRDSIVSAHAVLSGEMLTQSWQAGAQATLTGSMDALSLAGACAVDGLDWKWSDQDQLNLVAQAALRQHLLATHEFAEDSLRLSPRWVEVDSQGAASLCEEGGLQERQSLSEDCDVPTDSGISTATRLAEMQDGMLPVEVIVQDGYRVVGQFSIRETEPESDLDHVSRILVDGIQSQAGVTDVWRRLWSAQVAENRSFDSLLQVEAKTKSEDEALRLAEWLTGLNVATPWNVRIDPRSTVRCTPNLQVWPTTVPREALECSVEVRTAGEWA